MENCEFCDKSYIGKSAKSNLEKHLKHCIFNPKSIKYKCDICEKEFDKRHALNGHKKSCGNFHLVKKKLEEKIHECIYCKSIFDSGVKLGGHVVNCKSDPYYEDKRKNISIKISNSNKNRVLSDDTKNKISVSRKKYLQENPDQVPYKLNHSSKESYPEKYFTEIFDTEEIEVIKYYHIGLYELDFCILDKKINIEIDGSQHYYDYKIVESDKRRNKFLEDKGWDIIRINWAEYQKLNTLDKKEYIINLKNYINNLIDTKPVINILPNVNKCSCGVEISKNSNLCTSCFRLGSRKVERPSTIQLMEDISNLGYLGTGRKYGVSDNSIRKWIKNDK
jgi:very-short-patch-repair endonuclease